MMKLKKRTFLILMAALTATFASAQKQPLPGKQSYKAACHFRLLLILYGKYRFTGEKVVPAARHYLRRAWNQGYVMCQVSIATSGYYRR